MVVDLVADLIVELAVGLVEDVIFVVVVGSVDDMSLVLTVPRVSLFGCPLASPPSPKSCSPTKCPLLSPSPALLSFRGLTLSSSNNLTIRLFSLAQTGLSPS